MYVHCNIVYLECFVGIRPTWHARESTLFEVSVPGRFYRVVSLCKLRGPAVEVIYAKLICLRTSCYTDHEGSLIKERFLVDFQTISKHNIKFADYNFKTYFNFNRETCILLKWKLTISVPSRKQKLEILYSMYLN